MWYPDNFDLADRLEKRLEQGYEFNYPNDAQLDGLQIEKFN